MIAQSYRLRMVWSDVDAPDSSGEMIIHAANRGEAASTAEALCRGIAGGNKPLGFDLLDCAGTPVFHFRRA